MNCKKCDNKLSYGERYCNKCGEAIPAQIYEAQYNKSFWAKIDSVHEMYNSLFLKKITGSIAFKIISLIVVVGYFFFTMYGNFTGIRLKENADYTIEYNTKLDEYYIILNNESGNLDMFVPYGTDKIVFEGNNSGQKPSEAEFTVEEYKETGYEIKEDDYEYINAKAIRKGKTADSVKIIVISQ